jgi:hypothetical protein
MELPASWLDKCLAEIQILAHNGAESIVVEEDKEVMPALRRV